MYSFNQIYGEGTFVPYNFCFIYFIDETEAWREYLTVWALSTKWAIILSLGGLGIVLLITA